MAIIQRPPISSSSMISPLEKEMIVQEITETLSKNLNGSPQERPILVLLGGFQGSGKSTVAHSLRKTHQFVVISTDVIRYKLLEKSIIGKLFAEMVITISKILLIKAVENRLHIVMDANAHAKRIGEITTLLIPYPAYRILKILLLCSEEKLIQRLESRPKLEGCYQGQIADLRGSLNSVFFILTDYHLTLITDDLLLAKESEKINSFLIPYLRS